MAHHTINGCNLEVGDLLASGTISGPDAESFGSMLELTWNGKRPLKLPDNRVRSFIENGDTISIRGYAMRDGVRIGFGECKGRIQPAIL